jgi:protocatechuate 3,4-dioxygenase beta subunit
MKLFSPVLLLSILVSRMAVAQTDSLSLLKEAAMKLQNHSATVSFLLIEKKYSSLHPLVSFREMIRKYSSSDVLTIAPDDEPGKRIKVIGYVKNKNGQAVANALVYLYQTDSRGWYAADAPHVLMNEGDYRHARLFGYVKTDKNGKFELHTVKPSGYPNSDLPAHIHVHMTAEGYHPSGTEFLFQDDERLKGEILNRAVINGGMIAKPEPAEAPFAQKFSYEIKLRKE